MKKLATWAMQRMPHLTQAALPHLLYRRQEPWEAEFQAAAEQAMQQAGMWTKERASSIAMLHAKFVADVLFMEHASDKAIAARSVRTIGLTTKAISDVMAKGRGVIIGCSNFGCFYEGLLQCKGVFDDILIVLGGEPQRGSGLKERLESLTGMSIRLVTVNPRSAISISRQLHRGGAVATMLDTYIPGSPKVIAPFMGRPAASPAGIYQIASRQNAVIFPVFTFRRKRGTDVEICLPIDAGGQETIALAGAVNACIEQRIRFAPEAWAMWPALLERWSAATTCQ